MLKSTAQKIEKYNMWIAETSARRDCTSPKKAAVEVIKNITDFNQEHFIVIALDVKNKVIASKTIFMGTVNTSIVHPREAFHFAVLHSACSIVIAHNHPGGGTEPSVEDDKVYEKFKQCGEILGISVIDSLILGNGKMFSAAEKATFDVRELI